AIEAFLITYKIDITILRMRKEILIATLLFLYFSGMIALAMAEGTFISDSTYSHIEYEQHSYFRFADSLGANKKMFKAVAAFKSAMDKFSNENDFRGHITASCKMAGILIGLRQFPEEKEALNEAVRSFRHIPDD